ncbi:MAG: hypothetical protein B6U88_01645 [Candidatus Aenigmarchaeota archaeon ex4484_56]|nr:MAG: hypothetical protein B6U88_01645 [Candidatus Aenigmarchaeota archaeon ex4484_56]
MISIKTLMLLILLILLLSTAILYYKIFIKKIIAISLILFGLFFTTKFPANDYQLEDFSKIGITLGILCILLGICFLIW